MTTKHNASAESLPTPSSSTTPRSLNQLPAESRYKRASDSNGNLSNQELVALAERLQKDIELKSRRDKWRWYPDSFRGSQAVTWLIENTSVDSRDAAVELGATMLGRGLIFHVRHRHGFQDKRSRLYRFQNPEDTSDSGESDAASVASSVAVAAKRRTPGSKCITSRGNKWSKGQELSRLQGRVLELDIQIEDQKDMQGILLDAISEQIRGMQSITRLLTGKLEKASKRVSDLEVWLVASVVVQMLSFLWLSGSRVLAVALLVVSLNVAFIWYQSRQSGEDEQNQLGNEDSRSLIQEGSDSSKTLQGWQDSNDSAVHDVAKGRQLLEAQGGASLSNPSCGSSSVSGSSEMDERQLNQLPSMTIRRIAEESPLNSRSSKQISPHAEETGKEDSHKEDSRIDWSGPPSSSDIRDWPDSPLLVRPKALPYQTCRNLVKGSVQINTGKPVEFETDLFKGVAVIWVQGLESTPPDLFAGKNRKTSVTFQGRFKEPAGFDDVVTGQEFGRPAVNLPAKWLVESVLIKIARSISPSMSIGPLSKPFLLVPAIAAAQVVNCSMPGDEPDPSRIVPENLTLFDSTLVDSRGSPLPWQKRQRMFWNPQKRKDRSYTPDHVWTFTMYQSQVNMGSYGLDVALRYDLSRHLDGQPLQFMLKDRKRDTYLCNFEAWHEKLIAALEKAQEREKTA